MSTPGSIFEQGASRPSTSKLDNTHSSEVIELSDTPVEFDDMDTDSEVEVVSFLEGDSNTSQPIELGDSEKAMDFDHDPEKSASNGVNSDSEEVQVVNTSLFSKPLELSDSDDGAYTVNHYGYAVSESIYRANFASRSQRHMYRSHWLVFK